MNSAWDVFAERQRERRGVNAQGKATWFNWTHYEDHGPGVEPLTELMPCTVVDLGCGSGANLAHLASLNVGGRCIGVDVSGRQLARAEERWGHTAGLEFVRQDAVEYLQQTAEKFDVAYSVYGALTFCDPNVLLPLLHERMLPGGVLCFSTFPASEGGSGRRRAPMPGASGDVFRWDYLTSEWEELLRHHGFGKVETSVAGAPESEDLGTVLVRACKS